MTRRMTAFLAGLALTSAVATADEHINNEAEIRIQIEAKHEFATAACNARLEVEYYQKGPSVHVETELSNEDCAASSGSYTLQVRYRDADGETEIESFEETWQRDDDQPVRLEKDYYIAENVDILRVRSRRLRCECAAASDDAEAATGD